MARIRCLSTKTLEEIVLFRRFLFKPFLSQNFCEKKRSIYINTAEDKKGQASQTTLCEEELEKFRKLSGKWWDAFGEFRPLHAMNKLRVPLIRDGILQTRLLQKAHLSSSKPLKGMEILDVGCGGGLLAESLARLGAVVTGIDVIEENITVAKHHASTDSSLIDLNYICRSVEDHCIQHEEHYDAVVASEVAEHVHDLPYFISTLAKLTKVNGSLFITTLNKTYRSWLLGIIAAEYVLKLVPPGTHDWNKFIPPQELEYLLQTNSCEVVVVHGMIYNPIWNQWYWIPDTGINYAMHAVKRINKESVRQVDEEMPQLQSSANSQR